MIALPKFDRLGAIASLLYPPVCAICREDVCAGEHLCDPCEAKIVRIVAPFCQKCSEPFDGAITHEFTCANCAHRTIHFDAAVAAFVLCSVEDQNEVLAEAWRVLRPGGKLVVLEHVLGAGGTARWQNRLTPLHRRMAGNCHLNRDTRAAVARAGFDVADVESTLLPGTHALVRPGIQGVAIKTSS